MICPKTCACIGQGNKDILMIGYESKIGAEEMHACRIERRTLHGWLRLQGVTPAACAPFLPLLPSAMGGPRFP